jgi:phytoene synthase
MPPNMTETSLNRLPEAYKFCDGIARRRARNFYLAFRFLPKKRRLALSTFYAWCALSDDISDDSKALAPDQRHQKLIQWRTSLDDCFAGRADSPLFLALSDSLQHYDLPLQSFYDLLDGIEMDLEPRRYATFSDLEIYCRRVASSVGRVSLRIFGCTTPGADLYADNLGIAFQLTNILRDVAEDINAGRLYLPLEDLRRFDYSEAELRACVRDRRFHELMSFEYNRAWSYFKIADPALAGNQKHRLFPAQIMKAVYWRVLHELKRRNFEVFERRITIPWWRKTSALAVTTVQRLI